MKWNYHKIILQKQRFLMSLKKYYDKIIKEHKKWIHDVKISFWKIFFFFFFFDILKVNWQQDSPVHDVDYESFDSILCSNRSQKSQEISIQRNSNDVRMLCKQESWSCRVFIYATTLFLTVTINLQRRLMTCQCQ